MRGCRSTCIDPEVKRSKGQGYTVIRCAADVDMQVDMTVLDNQAVSLEI